MQTAYDLVWLAAERYPDQIALVDDRSDRALTYRELVDALDSIAAGFAERGVEAGMRIATVLPNLFEHCLILFALQRIAAVPAVINFRLTAADIGKLIEHGEIQGAIIPSDDALADVVTAALPKGGLLFSVGGDTALSDDFAACRGDPAGLPPRPTPDPEDPAFIFYTSGTTGLPKGVVVPHRAIEHRVLWISPPTGLRFGTDLRALGCSPLNHAIGFFCVYLVTLAYNGTYYVMSAFDPAKAVDMIERHRINFVFAVPTIFHMLMNAPNYRPERMASLDFVMFGGAPTPASLLRQMRDEWSANLHHIFGATECMVPLHNADPVDQPTVLRPTFYARVRVIKVGGAPDQIVTPGDEGELIVDASADTMFTGYLNRPDATAEKLHDAWYFTGDICRLLENGDLDLRGRVDDVVRTGGENVHPDEVEAHLVQHPGVREAAVVGVTDARWGQMVVGCVVAAAGTNPEDLDHFCRSSGLAGFKRPRGYVFIDRLPRNAANKVLRRNLREMASEAREIQGEPRFYDLGKP